mmetsp:Transcript_35009/g.82548  ORF Transcript_35009/g.82548 Transcript_35009/m.82548 type:complete len:211 (-) Transcript_35009:28-660(-)
MSNMLFTDVSGRQGESSSSRSRPPWMATTATLATNRSGSASIASAKSRRDATQTMVRLLGLASRRICMSSACPSTRSASSRTCPCPSSRYSCGCALYGVPSEPTPTGTPAAPRWSSTQRASCARSRGWPPPLQMTAHSSMRPWRWSIAATRRALTSSGSGPGSVTSTNGRRTVDEMLARQEALLSRLCFHGATLGGSMCLLAPGCFGVVP